MSERNEQISILRNAFQLIQAKAIAIDNNKGNPPQARADARRIMELTDDAFECCLAILKLVKPEDVREAVAKASDPNAPLGATGKG